MNTPSRDNPTAKSCDRCSYECKFWIVVLINLPLATDPVSTRPSRLANVRHYLIRHTFILECRRRINTGIITRVVSNLLLSTKISWILSLTKLLDKSWSISRTERWNSKLRIRSLFERCSLQSQSEPSFRTIAAAPGIVLWCILALHRLQRHIRRGNTPGCLHFFARVMPKN